MRGTLTDAIKWNELLNRATVAGLQANSRVDSVELIYPSKDNPRDYERGGRRYFYYSRSDDYEKLEQCIQEYELWTKGLSAAKISIAEEKLVERAFTLGIDVNPFWQLPECRWLITYSYGLEAWESVSYYRLSEAGIKQFKEEMDTLSDSASITSQAADSLIKTRSFLKEMDYLSGTLARKGICVVQQTAQNHNEFAIYGGFGVKPRHYARNSEGMALAYKEWLSISLASIRPISSWDM